MFSIIIPLYNKEKHIHSTIQSILNQTFGEFEIIVVDDGSTDNSYQLVEEMKDPRIRSFRQKNKGVSAARNLGIKNANYEWICFLDADDLWEKDFLQEYFNVIVRNPEINWLFSGYFVLGRDGMKREIIYERGDEIGDIIEHLKRGVKFWTGVMCIRRDLFKKNEELYFRKGMNRSEDREVWLKLCLMDSKPYYIKKCLAVYVKDDNKSLTTIESIDYLSMKERIVTSSMYKQSELTTQEKRTFIEWVEKYTQGLILSDFVNHQKLNSEVRHYLTKFEWRLLSATVFLPKFFKRIIRKTFTLSRI